LDFNRGIPALSLSAAVKNQAITDTAGGREASSWPGTPLIKEDSMKYRLITIAAMLAVTSAAAAQQSSAVRLELRPFAARYVPIGSQSDDFQSAAAYGLQTALELNRHTHLLASVGWTDGRSKMSWLSKDGAAIWQYDFGAEFNGVAEMGYGWLFRPFVGVGAGARTYDYEATEANSRTCSAGYAALGSEFQTGPLALRFESRGYVNCYQSPLNSSKKNRGDLLFALGFAYHVN
jgi:hypothetical protein